MNIVNPIPGQVETMLLNLEQTGPINMLPVNGGSHSSVYRIGDFCLKVFNEKGVFYGGNECVALLKLQEKPYVPKIFAYNPEMYILMDGLTDTPYTNIIRNFMSFHRN